MNASGIDRAGCNRRPNVVFGGLLVAWGVLALLDSLQLVELRNVLRTFWPLLMIGWGLTTLSFDRGRRWLGVVAVVLGTVFLGNQLMWWSLRVSRLWPLILIAVGVRVMLRRGGWRRPRRHRHRGYTEEAEVSPSDAVPTAGETADDQTSQGATLRELAIFGGVERRIASQAFRGGEATAVFGGVQLDLRECRMAGTEAHIDVLAMLGGVSLTLPRDWAVESRVSAILGGVEDRSSPPLDAAPKRLVLTGQAILGGIEIKN